MFATGRVRLTGNDHSTSRLLRAMVIGLIAVAAVYAVAVFGLLPYESSPFWDLVLSLITLVIGYFEGWGVPRLVGDTLKERSVGNAKPFYVASLVLVSLLGVTAFWYLLSRGTYGLLPTFALAFCLGAAIGVASLARSVWDS